MRVGTCRCIAALPCPALPGGSLSPSRPAAREREFLRFAFDNAIACSRGRLTGSPDGKPLGRAACPICWCRSAGPAPCIHGRLSSKANPSTAFRGRACVCSGRRARQGGSAWCVSSNPPSKTTVRRMDEGTLAGDQARERTSLPIIAPTPARHSERMSSASIRGVFGARGRLRCLLTYPYLLYTYPVDTEYYLGSRARNGARPLWGSDGEGAFSLGSKWIGRAIIQTSSY